MGREDGFVVADVSSGHFDDDKVRALWRRISAREESDLAVAWMTEAMCLHLSTVLASWRAGRRVSVDEAVPLWLPVREDLVADLIAVRLIDRSRRVPARSWSDWYGPAAARKAARVEAGRLGGLASGKHRSSNRSATLYPTGRQAGPSVPSESVRPNRARRASSGDAPRSPREAMLEAGGFAAELVARGEKP